MKEKQMMSNIFLLLAAMIWGLAFVAQRVGVEYIGSFTLNGVRFALGSISLLPLIIFWDKKSKADGKTQKDTVKNALPAGILIGTVLFGAASLQQIGLVYTSAGKAAFLTGLYIAIVPILGMFLKHKTNFITWAGVVLAVIGLYLLSVNKGFSISKGDLYEIAGAVLWAVHILLIDNFVKKISALKLSCIQFSTCSIFSLIAAAATEKITLFGLQQALIPILYTGICSTALGYTFQAVGQKNADPSHAAIIMSLESVFASIGGVVLLHEVLPIKGYVGCIMMLAGMILSQFKITQKAA